LPKAATTFRQVTLTTQPVAESILPNPPRPIGASKRQAGVLNARLAHRSGQQPAANPGDFRTVGAALGREHAIVCRCPRHAPQWIAAAAGLLGSDGHVHLALHLAELGFLVHCSRDYAMAESFSNDLTLTRTQTIMQGAAHCDFHYERKA
jgi:hypothetical protein